MGCGATTGSTVYVVSRDSGDHRRGNGVDNATSSSSRLEADHLPKRDVQLATKDFRLMASSLKSSGMKVCRRLGTELEALLNDQEAQAEGAKALLQRPPIAAP